MPPFSTVADAVTAITASQTTLAREDTALPSGEGPLAQVRDVLTELIETLPQINLGPGDVHATVIAGGTAGDHTVTGIATTDNLRAVLHLDLGANGETDLTSEFSITAADTINNDAGTDTSADTLIVLYTRPQ